jgi:CubicO group peptidase (beta-lactamase class C family)
LARLEDMLRAKVMACQGHYAQVDLVNPAAPHPAGYETLALVDVEAQYTFFPPHAFSLTKAVVGTQIAHLYLTKNLPIEQDVSPLVAHFGLDPARFSKCSIISLLHHQTGLPGENDASIAEGILLIKHNQPSHAMVRQGLHVKSRRAEPGGEGGPRPPQFEYCNFGFQLAIMLSEHLMRVRQQKTDPHKFETDPAFMFMVQRECLTSYLPFKPVHAPDWATCAGDSIHKHTWGHAHLLLTGSEMAEFAHHMYKNHLPLLKFIAGVAPYERAKRYGGLTHNRFIVKDACDLGTTPGQDGQTRSDYSFGWRIFRFAPILLGRKQPERLYLTGNGMLGQYVAIDIATGTVAVRAHRIDPKLMSKGLHNHHVEFYKHADLFIRAYEIMSAPETTRQEAEQILYEFEAGLV